MQFREEGATAKREEDKRPRKSNQEAPHPRSAKYVQAHKSKSVYTLKHKQEVIDMCKDLTDSPNEATCPICSKPSPPDLLKCPHSAASLSNAEVKETIEVAKPRADYRTVEKNAEVISGILVVLGALPPLLRQLASHENVLPAHFALFLGGLVGSYFGGRFLLSPLLVALYFAIKGKPKPAPVVTQIEQILKDVEEGKRVEPLPANYCATVRADLLSEHQVFSSILAAYARHPDLIHKWLDSERPEIKTFLAKHVADLAPSLEIQAASIQTRGTDAIVKVALFVAVLLVFASCNLVKSFTVSPEEPINPAEYRATFLIFAIPALAFGCAIPIFRLRIRSRQTRLNDERLVLIRFRQILDNPDVGSPPSVTSQSCPFPNKRPPA